MSDNLNIFYDERINGVTAPPPVPDMWIPGRPPYEHPGPCCPDGRIVNPYVPGVPNPVPNRYFFPYPRPKPCRPEEFFVLKRQLNEILKNIAKADIFVDKSEEGTTIDVGGIPKGTKLDKITFSELIQMLLYPVVDDEVQPDPEVVPEEEEYVKKEDLENLVKAFLATVSWTGSYSDLINTPAIPSLTWPSGKKTEVVNNLGGFKAGDSLEGMNLVDIIEKLLCEEAN